MSCRGLAGAMPRVFKPRAGFHAPSYHSHHDFQQDQLLLGVRIREVLWWQRYQLTIVRGEQGLC